MNSLCRVSPTKTELLFTYLWASSTRIRLQRVCAGVDIVTCEGSCACSSRVNAGMPACACDVRTKSTVVEVGPSRASRPIWQAGSVLSRCRARSKQDSARRGEPKRAHRRLTRRARDDSSRKQGCLRAEVDAGLPLRSGELKFRVEDWRGKPFDRAPVSSPRSWNRTSGSPASGLLRPIVGE